ncbi:hypothetical protein H681_06040 [Pseudomonas sp. ATCC 13867]|nr:hypothetical protein H681_06040 [Pseudomonas sp. ATCC 13867]
MCVMRIRKAALAVITGIWLAGCTATPPESLPTPIEGYNHTSAAINWFKVNGAGGSNFGPHLGGWESDLLRFSADEMASRPEGSD